MKKIFLVLSILLIVQFIFDVPKTQAGATTEPLLYEDDLIYEGAFKVPNDESFDSTGGFGYGGTALGYNPLNDSLFITGYDRFQLTAEVKIPQVINSNNVNDLATAQLLQNFTDVTGGKRNLVVTDSANGTKIGGHLVYNGKLYASAYAYYATAGAELSSHFISTLNLAESGNALGPFKVGNINPGYVAGSMGIIPSEWQSLLGGPAFTGQCCLSVMAGRTSLGPSLSVFNPEDLGVIDPVPATPLVYYPINHPGIGTYYNGGVPGPYYAGGTDAKGTVFPDGTRTILFFGTRGIGPSCYGEATDCNDIVGNKGEHSPPYVFQVWAYDANDLLAVKNGQKQPWEVMPYTGWTLNFALPLPATGPIIGGATYDPVTKRIFVSQLYGEIIGYGRLPLIHVFRVVPRSRKPEVDFSVSKSSINLGESTTLNWSVTNANSVNIDNSIGIVSPSGSLAITPDAVKSFKITAVNSSGTTTKYVMVWVNFPADPVLTSLTASPLVVHAGEPVNISWTSQNTAYATLGYVGQVPVSGSTTVYPINTKNYILTVGSPLSYTHQSITINVSASTDTTPPSAPVGIVVN